MSIVVGELLEDRRLAVVATARERVARLGVRASSSSPPPPPTLAKKRRLSDTTTSSSSFLDDAGSLVVRTSDCRVLALDSATRYTIFGALMAKRPRRAHEPSSDEPTCVVCMDDEQPTAVAVANTTDHRCAIARRAAICVECTRRLLSQRSPLACPLCRHPINIDDIVVVERRRSDSSKSPIVV